MKVFICFILILLSCSVVNSQSLTFKENTEININFWEALPPSYNTNTEYPVIIYLHGRGERGDGTRESANNILTWGPLRHIKNDRFPAFTHDGKAYHFIVIAPQLNKPKSLWSPDIIDQTIKHTIDNYSVDQTKIYLTGPSMGGNGTWIYTYSDYNSDNKIAAIAPIASWGNEDKACKVAVRNIAVWAFHGEDDNIIPIKRGREVFEAAKSCSTNDLPDMKFTSYDNTKHNSWQMAYDPRNTFHSPNLYEWFLSHSLPKKIKENIEVNNEEIQPTENLSNPFISTHTLSKSLHESSGLAVDKNGNIWSHNDSGNGPYIFKIDSTGNAAEYKKVTYATNYDWEDLTIDENNNLYIADIGNNDNTRKKFSIYKVNLNTQEDRLKAESITFTYPDQHEFPPIPSKLDFDAESIIYLNDSLYIFNKSRREPFDGIVKVYKLPSMPGEYQAELIDSLQLEITAPGMINNWITSATIDKKGKIVLLLTHDKVWAITCFSGGKFSNGQIQKINLNHYSQKEGITFTNKQTIAITDELFRNIIGGKIYRMDLPKLLNDCNKNL
ncbi:MAG: alpha/beta hydrolase-fold protein [Fulvivirga sp.]